MRSDLSDVTVVLDRSGSMMTCKEDAEGGVNAFIEEQKKAEGECLFTLVQFDDRYEFVHKGVPIGDIQKYELHPRGSTALLDAIGRAITETGERLSAMDEADRPGLVVFVIVTDGGENASNEFTRAAIKEMIERQQNEYSWKFTFLGANQDAFGEAASLGITRGATANYSVASSGAAFKAASMNTMRMRSASLSNLPVCDEYTEDERTSMQ